jgi:Arc/MetJ family transcription regulator
MKDKILLSIAGILVVFAVFKPYLETMTIVDNKPTVVVEEISEDQKELVQDIVDAVKNGSEDRVFDGKHLASLYTNLAKLIELDNEDKLIESTSDIAQANSLSGRLLKLDLNGKYDGVGKLSSDYVKSQIGSDDVNLDDELRAKAVEAFKSLAWAFNEGSK